MATFKKRFTIKGLNDWLDPPERQRCGTAIYQLSKLVLMMEEKQTIYRVQVGAFQNRAYAEAYLEKLKADGYDGFIVSV